MVRGKNQSSKNPGNISASPSIRAVEALEKDSQNLESNTVPQLLNMTETVGNPYSLHSSEHPGLILVTHVLHGSNYNPWKRAMSMALNAKNKLSLVDGSIQKPLLNDVNFRLWSRCDSMVTSWILNSVSKEIAESLLYLSSAKEVWDDLSERFSQTSGPRIYELRRLLMTTSQGSLDISSYYTKMKILWDELQQSRPIQICKCPGMKDLLVHHHQDYVIQFLIGLNDSYSQIRSQILMMDPIPTISKVFSLIIQEERQRLVGNKGVATEAVSFQSSFNQNVKGRKEKSYCTHCKFTGHTIEKCYKLHGYPPGYKPKRPLVNQAIVHRNSVDCFDKNFQMKDIEQKQSADLTADQCQQLIAFLSNKLQGDSQPTLNLQNTPSAFSFSAGKLENNRIVWRGDSGLGDGTEENLDLSKGLFDAGDLIKFGFPLAFTATVLSWAILEYGDNMKETKQLDFAQDSLKWITDYLINAHPSPNLLYIQVGDPESDHRCWQRPENMTERRPLTKINSSHPGTEVAAETAAAMASAALVFKTINSSYSDLLIKHSEQLFSFADLYRGSYSISIPQVQTYYNSSGYGDELLWAATWLYFATGDGSYLRYVTEQNGQAFSGWEDPSWFSWDDKHSGVQVLLSRVDLFGRGDNTSTVEDIDLQIYSKSAEAIMCALLPDSPTATSCITKSGLIWVESYNSLQHSVASAFLAVLYSDYMVASEIKMINCDEKLYGPDDLRNFASSQADYVLGKNPMEMSYLVGHGGRYPEFVHHRGASIPVDAATGCADGFKWLESMEPNPNLAVGALVGGPFFNESYMDLRNNSMQGEPCTYSNALLVGLLSGLVASYTVIRPF